MKRTLTWMAVLVPAALIGVVVGFVLVLQPPDGGCGSGSGDPASSSGPPGGNLGGVAGTGVSPAEVRVVRASPLAGDNFQPGDYLATAYGPPWNELQGWGQATAGGLIWNGGAPHQYVIATDPSVISLGKLVYPWPNPFNWHGAFLAADTGGAILGRHIDYYDWRGRQTQLQWNDQVKVSSQPQFGRLDDPIDELRIPGPTTAVPEAGGPVDVIGDSLAVGSATALERALGGSWSVRTDAKIGRGTAAGLAALKARRPTGVVVLELGTNDDPDASAFADNVDRAMRIVAVTQPVFWVNIAAPGHAALNRVLDRKGREYPNLHVIDWAGLVGEQNLRLDPTLHVHPTPAGYTARGRLIASAVRDTGAPVTPSTSPEQAAAECGEQIAVGNVDFEHAHQDSSPGRMIELPTWATAQGYTSAAITDGHAKIDSRIAGNLLYILQRYDLRVHDCLASGHNTHGQGDSCDIVPADDPLPRPGRMTPGWSNVTRLARDLGWEPPGPGYPGGYACNSGMPFAPAIYIVCYDGDLNHGDPEHFTGGCACPHLHLTWQSAIHGAPVALSAPPPWVMVFDQATTADPTNPDGEARPPGSKPDVRPVRGPGGRRSGAGTS